jgi:Sortase domain
VFYRLSRLRKGDKIVVVRRDGSRARFTVQGSERFPKDAFPTARVYGRTDAPTLRLITCGGAFDSSTGHYVDNTIVYAR